MIGTRGLVLLERRDTAVRVAGDNHRPVAERIGIYLFPDLVRDKVRGLRRLALGEDDRPVVVERERKSISAETTLPRDSGDPDLLIELVNRLSQRVGAHLERNGAQGRTVKIKLRLADFTTFTRQTTVSYPVRSASEVAAVAGDLVRAETRPGRLFRLVGVGVSGFDQPTERPSQPRLTGFG